jgi:beta-glucosidase
LVVQGGAWLVMAAYNSVNGITMTENPLLRDPLKTDWGVQWRGRVRLVGGPLH